MPLLFISRELIPHVSEPKGEGPAGWGTPPPTPGPAVRGGASRGQRRPGPQQLWKGGRGSQHSADGDGLRLYPGLGAPTP